MNENIIADEKIRKLVRNLGLMVIMYSGFMVLCNLIPVFALSFIAENIALPEGELKGLGWMFEHMFEVGISVATIGAVNIVGGIYLLKYRNWARILLIISSVLITFGLALFSVVMYDFFNRPEFMNFRIFIAFSLIISALSFVAPFFVLVYYLFQKNVAALFREV